MSFKFKDDDFWIDRLTSEQFQITRKGGTERPFTGKYLDNKDEGHYSCICCGKICYLWVKLASLVLFDASI